MIETNTLWQRMSEPGRGQVHLVVIVSKDEVVTVGIPYGTGFTWMGSPSDFVEQFQFRGTMKQ